MRFGRVLIATVVLFAHAVAYAQDVAPRSDYTVPDVPVEATASDATAARMSAMTQGEDLAFTQLLQQMLTPQEAAAKRATTTPDRISRMVKSYGVHEERISGNTYSAKLDVAFDPAQVLAFLSNTVPVAPTFAAPSGGGYVYSPVRLSKPDNSTLETSTLVLPVLLTDKAPLLWEPENSWRAAWNGVSRADKNAVRLPVGDDSDVAVISAEQALHAPASEFNAIAERYQSGKIIVAIAHPHEEPSGAKLDVVLHSIDRNGQVRDTQTRYAAELDEDMAHLLIRATQDIVGGLVASPQNVVIRPPIVQGSRITLLASIRGAQNFSMLRQKLSRLSGVQKLELSALSNDQADMVLYYNGALQPLAAHMVSNGIRIKQMPDYWIIAL